ncbi:MAG: arylamine N-acetyltransferase [Oricola sp.]
MDTDRYLRRIGIDRPRPTAEGLAALQSAQMRAITFENIDPLLGAVPDVSLAGIFAKLVDTGRGGYCFELNTLFGAALSAFGFETTRIMARVRNGAPQGGPRSHLAWIVTIDGEEWLADTGFGGSGTSVPLRLSSRDAQAAPTGRYRFAQDDASGELVLERETPEGWFSLFGFDRVPVRDADIETANFVTARWEKAPFPANLMLSRHREDGRISLLNTALRIEAGDGVTKSVIGSLPELHDRLADDFALPVDRSMAGAIWDRLEKLGHIERMAV